jgi:hypothetical protein
LSIYTGIASKEAYTGILSLGVGITPVPRWRDRFVLDGLSYKFLKVDRHVIGVLNGKESLMGPVHGPGFGVARAGMKAMPYVM